MKVYDLRVNNISAPLGIDEVPYFSWKIDSDDFDVMQTAYRINVCEKNGGEVWNSGKKVSDTSCFINYEGVELKSKTEYEWSVCVWDNYGKAAEGRGAFETAFFGEREWRGKWMESPYPVEKRGKGPGEQCPATMFRKTFRLSDKKIKRARLYATCHGIYRIYINGIRPDDREFAPENTTYSKMICYQIYNVSDYLKTGENILEMYVGDGWYCCAAYREEGVTTEPLHAVLFQIETEYVDGEKKIIVSDEQVEASQGMIRYSDIFSGEKYDAGRTFEIWQKSIVKQYGYDKLCAQPEEPVRPVAVLQAKELLHSPKGELIVDFGQIIAGRVRITLDIPRGRMVALDHYEVLDQEGNCFDNLKLLKEDTSDRCQRDEFVSAGQACVYEPYFTFHGFRYVRISGIDDIKLDDISAVALSTEKKNAGTFECSNEKLNRLYVNTRWSQRANMMSIPTDCPQREKAGWTGDITVYAKTSLLNEETTNLLNRWLKNLALDQDKYGAVPFVSPYTGHYPGLAKSFGRIFGNKGDAIVASAGWGDAAVVVPYKIYEITGNTHILNQQYDSMKAWCDYIIKEASGRKGSLFAKKEVDRYLWNTGFHWGEWLIPSLSKNGFDIHTILGIKKTLRYVAPSYAYQSIRMMADTAHIAGNAADEKYYSGIAEKIKDAFAKEVITKKGKMREKFMGAYVIPIAFDLVPEEYQTNFAEELIDSIERNNYCLDTGFLATPFLLSALQKIGRIDLAFKLLYQTKCPSWLFEVDHGATTIWESWYGYSKDNKPLDVSMNHYALGCVDEWIFENITGIKNASAGFKNILIQPHPDNDMTWVKRSFECSYGTIVSQWEKKGKKYHFCVEIPCNTKVKIILPDGQSFERGSGRYEFMT